LFDEFSFDVVFCGGGAFVWIGGVGDVSCWVSAMVGVVYDLVVLFAIL